MSNSRSAKRSIEEWITLITECRQSGLSDAAWCEQQGMSVSSFYNATTRLRKKAYEIPKPVGNTATLDPTSDHPDVVRIDIQPERVPAKVIRPMDTSAHIDNPHTMELKMDDVSIKISNSADPFLLKQIVRMLRPVRC